MGRPFKEGLDYFELDCQMDEKVKLIQAQFGLKGFAVIVKLFQHIYGEHGYYCEWNEDALFLFMSENCSGGGGDNKNLIEEIVGACIKRGIFSAEMYEKHGILTSEGIQKRYLRATAKRSGLKLKKGYLLVHCAQNKISSVNNSVSSVNNSVSSVNNPQRREEKRRVEKRREEYRQPGFLTPEKRQSYSDLADYHRDNVQKMIENRNFPPKVEILVKDWVKFKEQMGYPYFDTNGYALVVLIADKLEQIGADAVCEAITASIANGYKGIVFGDTKKKSNEKVTGNSFSGNGIGGYDWDAIRRSLDD